MSQPSIINDLKTSSKAIVGVIAFTTAVSTILVDIFGFAPHWTIGITMAVTLLIICSILFMARLEARQTSVLEAHIKESSEVFENIEKSLVDLRGMVGKVRQDTLRIQLRTYLKDEPENIDTILTIANEYFGSSHGNWIATHEFLEWAEKNHVHVPNQINQAISTIDSKN